MRLMKTFANLSLLALVLAAALALASSARAAERNQPASATRTLFNGQNMSGWRLPTGDWLAAGSVTLDKNDPTKFSVKSGSGILANGLQGRTVNLISEFEHSDVEAHLEFMVPKSSNSGVYFQGRYEIQVLDSWGVKAPKYGDCGGIYERWANGKGYEGQAPKINASRPPGEWQSFDVIFRAPRFNASGQKIENARFVKVSHNGQVVHENVEVTGPTRAATFETDEKPTGPLMLQGDHGPVAYRNLVLKAIQLK